jgi:hypothetical protein
LNSIGIKLNDDGVVLALATISSCDARIMFTPALEVDVKLGHISIDDKINRHTSQRHRRLITTDGEALRVGYTAVPPVLKIRGASVRVTYLEDFLQTLLSFCGSFFDSMVDRAREAAQEASSATQLVLDVALKAPIVVLPRDLVSPHVLVMDLGTLEIRNAYNDGLNRYAISVTQIKLSATTVDFLDAGDPLLHDTKLDITVVLSDDRSPNVDVDLMVPRVIFQATEKQLIMLLDLYQLVVNSPLAGGGGSQTSGRIKKQPSSERIADGDVRVGFKGRFQVPEISLELIKDKASFCSLKFLGSSPFLLY